MLALIVLLSILGFFIVSKIQRQIILRCQVISKSELSATRFFGLPYLVFGLVFCSLCVFVGLELLGSRKEREKEKVRCYFAQLLFPCLLLCLLSYI